MGGLLRLAFISTAALTLAGCDGAPIDFDLRSFGNGFDTSSAAQNATATRPQADARGVISYPNYQIVVARRGDTVAGIANRIGLGADELARHNGLLPDVGLRAGKVLALPRRVEEPSTATGAITSGPLTPGGVDLTSLAGQAIDRASALEPGHAPTREVAAGVEPIRHKVERGETAFTISRLYNVSVRALADWNGLSSDLAVREGQFLLIPVVIDPPAPDPETATPEPPSAADPLPTETPGADAEAPPSPELGGDDAAVGFQMPVAGSIIREFSKGKNDGIDIAASPGATVVAAADGTVAAITRDTDQVPIIVLRHADNILTVYAGVDQVTVAKGASVKRGQKIAVIRDADPSFLHFEVRRGLDSVDPMDFLS